jgi:hypothetical protein
MTPRERNMIIGILAVILLGGGAFAGYTFVLSPLQDTNALINKLHEDIDGDGSPDKPGLENRATTMKKAGPLLAVARRQSLPPNIDLAKTQYELLIERLLQQSKIDKYTIPEAKTPESKAPVVPEIAPKKPAYTRLQFHIVMQKVDIWQLSDFLYAFYQIDLLHQITDLTITRQNKVTDMRNGLEVTLNIEAIILDGAEMRSSLFPVALLKLTEESINALKTENLPDFVISKLNALKNKQFPQEDFLRELRKILNVNEMQQYQYVILKNVSVIITPAGEAVAAIGGGRALQAVVAQPELMRKVTALANTRVLAARPRDYSLLALGDIFYGLLPADSSPTGLTIAKISDVEIKQGDKIPPVKVHLSGDGSDIATITATASGSMIPEGALKVDQETKTISFPTTKEDLTNYASATITVVASAETGKENKTSFKVSFERERITSVVKDDISSAIKLIMVSGGSDGVVTAIIYDSANPFRYKLTASAKNGIEVVKLYRLKADDWRKDDYNHPTGVLAFSDESSATKRNFKVVAIEPNGLIVADIGKPEIKPDAKPEQKGRGRPPGGGGPGGGPPRGGPADPLAALAGNLATAAPAPVLYMWVTGMSLKDLDDKDKKAKIAPDEARKILQRIAQNGQVLIPVSTSK